MLCHSCRSISFCQSKNGDTCHNVSVDCIVRGKASGCHLCSLLHEDIEAQFPRCLDASDSIFGSSNSRYLELRLCSDKWIPRDDKNDREADFGYTVLRATFKRREWRVWGVDKDSLGRRIERGLPPPDPLVGEYRLLAEKDGAAMKNMDIGLCYLGDDPRSSQHLTQIRALIDQCCSSHSKCCQSLTAAQRLDPLNAPLPTRCIRLHDDGSIQLCHTEGMTGSYMTLSHRWNDSTINCKTTYENLHWRLEQLATKTLPQNFQDAITFARKMGMKYVWIDSLCIVQHKTDWVSESLKMAQYYQNSLLNLALVDGSSAGFLRPRSGQSSELDRLIRLPYRNRQGDWDGFVYLCRGPNTFTDGEYRNNIPQSILLQRGWVFQEWLLSPRIVYFAPEQIFFECQTLRPISEKGGIVSTYGFNLLTFKSSFSERAPLQIWYAAVEAFSQSNLTKPEQDHVLALAGIATETRDAFAKQDHANMVHPNLEYLSGLWLRDIHYGLLWEQESSEGWKQATEVASAPSWSWASLMTAVNWPERVRKDIPILKVQQVICPSQDDTEPARVFEMSDLLQTPFPILDVGTTSCSLVVRTKIARVVVNSYLKGNNLSKMIDATENSPLRHLIRQSHTLDWNGICSESCPNVLAGWAHFERHQTDTEVELDNNASDMANMEAVVYAMHISTTSVKGGLGFGYLGFNHPVYSVLYCVRTSMGTFRRMGVGRIFAQELIREFESLEEEVLELV